jgi:hypothetical protein
MKLRISKISACDPLYIIAAARNNALENENITRVITEMEECSL